ncbi:hypothetical protein OEZ85_007224 [Tetradesmus obliquus]|uniref:Histone deacetylase domain-containing protein n=1 Tax=Tetradesmus obliquus TaxID=3088 RepID=A0ABY8TXD9_TETOB|nr:hypothetical protein OEZ85_007224 [Tetradesmus obliquus]
MRLLDILDQIPASSVGSSSSGLQPEAEAAAAAAGQQQEQQPDAPAALRSTAALSQRIEAGIALQQARQLLQDAGILQLPTTLLAWEDEELEPEPAMQLHRGLLPPNHERPERLRAVLARLRAAGLLDICGRLQPREATEEELLSVHSAGLIAAVAALSHANQPSDLNQVADHLSPDMLGNRYTYRAARTAAGTAAELARQLVTGQASNGMALIRPAGHVAGVDSGEAGNYFNNAAVAVRAAQAAGARRVMVIDWDVHHCKGTSEIFAEDPNVVVLSLHRYGSGFFPSSGPAEHVGVGRGRGRNINVAWCPPSVMDKRGRRIQVEAPPISDGDYLTAWHMLVLPIAAEFRPDLILVSAGFDAADKDPLGHYRVHPECFGHLTALLRPLAPLGLLLEGGYNLAATAASAEACVRALLGERPAPLRGTRCAGVTGWSSILRTLLVHQEHWQSLGMLNFLQLAGTPTSEEWEEVQDEVEEESEDEGYEVDAGDSEDGEEEEQELQEGEFAAVLATAVQGEAPGQASTSVDDFEPEEAL